MNEFIVVKEYTFIEDGWKCKYTELANGWATIVKLYRINDKTKTN